MLSPNDFSTNRHSSKDLVKISGADLLPPSRHPELCFGDGNLAILTGEHYFLVHQGFISRHSTFLDATIKALEEAPVRLLEGRPVLQLQDAPGDMQHLLMALYDGISGLKYNKSDFSVVSAILRLSTKYQIAHLRKSMIRGLSRAWPATLAQWESREADATNANGIYDPRRTLPHPILIINLARATDTPELLLSAFYDLSRCSPSDCATGYTCPETSIHHCLSDQDLMNLLRGKEHSSRLLSTFIVQELESRGPSPGCQYATTNAPDARRRNCQASFEAVTFEILRDANGALRHRNSDPLFAIMDAELMMSSGVDLSGRQNLAFRACEACRVEFASAASLCREDFWHLLPQWFNIKIVPWG